MNIAVKYVTNHGSGGAEETKPGNHTYMFDQNLEKTTKFSHVNDIFVEINNTVKEIDVKIGVGYSTRSFYGIQYTIKNTEGKYLTYDNSFCDLENCHVKGYLRDYDKIDGYNLKFSNDNKLIFKLELIELSNLRTTRCYVTYILGIQYILTYSPKRGRLILYNKIIPNNSYYSPNNICFITDNQDVYDNLVSLKLPIYSDINTNYIYLIQDLIEEQKYQEENLRDRTRF